jgi:predicted nucleotidyltransferase
MRTTIDIPTSQDLEPLCREYHMRRLSLFGSTARGDNHDDSDVDLLVEFAPGQTPDFFTFDELAERLSRLFGGRRIDLVTQASLHPLIRDCMAADLVTLYEG